MASHKIPLRIKHVHGASFPLGDSGGLAKQFSHDGLGIDTFGYGEPVIPISCDHVVVRVQGALHCTGGDSLLTVVQMAESHDFPHSV